MGFTPEMVAAMEAQVGPKAVMEQFLKIGIATGEDTFVGGNNGQSSIRSREGAAIRIKELMSDQAYAAAYTGGDQAKLREMTDLHTLAYG
jgi:hypothetical protein